MEWAPPCIGKVKVNFDGAPFGNSGSAGFVHLMQDHHGTIILAKGGPLGTTDGIHAESLGCLKGCVCLRVRVLKIA